MGLFADPLFIALIFIVVVGLAAVIIVFVTLKDKKETSLSLKEAVPTLQMAPPMIEDLSQAADSPFIKAGSNKRVCAYLIDMLVIVIPNLAPQLLSGAIYGLILPTLYILFRDCFNGQSIGKKLVGLRVVTDKNTVVGPTEACFRNITLGVGILFPPISLIEYIVMLRSPSGQRFGDKMAGTLVTDLKPQLKDNVFLFISIVIMFINAVIFVFETKMIHK